MVLNIQKLRLDIRRKNIRYVGYRYVAHLYCFAVQAGFYGDVVECLFHRQRVAGSIIGRVKTDDIFLHLLHLAPQRK